MGNEKALADLYVDISLKMNSMRGRVTDVKRFVEDDPNMSPEEKAAALYWIEEEARGYGCADGQGYLSGVYSR